VKSTRVEIEWSRPSLSARQAAEGAPAIGMRLLLVEDYAPLSRSLSQGLREAGYGVDVAEDGEAGLALAQARDYDVVVLDLMLPRLDGHAVLQRLRAAGSTVGVIILTARQELADRIEGLDLGADDYVVKPFAFDELLARVRSVARRRRQLSGDVIAVADLQINLAARRVERGGHVVPLSAREYALLEYLASRRGETVTRPEILAHVYDFAGEPSSNVVDVYIGYLRRKIDREGQVKLIHTRRGFGYRLGEPE
jgi:two-component system copper resistance phosphate regulon response regulator CusR